MPGDGRIATRLTRRSRGRRVFAPPVEECRPEVGRLNERLAPRGGAFSVREAHHERHVDQLAVQGLVARAQPQVLAHREASRGRDGQQRPLGRTALVEELQESVQARIQHRDLPGISLRVNQELVRIEAGREASVGHVGGGQERRIALAPVALAALRRGVPRRAQAADVAPEEERLPGPRRYSGDCTQSMSSTMHCARCVSS